MNLICVNKPLRLVIDLQKVQILSNVFQCTRKERFYGGE